MTIETLPFEHRPRNSIANNLDKINELIDWVNLDTHLYASASGERVTVDDTSSLKGLTVDGRSVQDGTPTPDAPVPVQVVKGKNLIPITTNKTVNGIRLTVNDDGTCTLNGTATSQASFYLVSDEIIVPDGTVSYLTGCPDGGSMDTYLMSTKNALGNWVNTYYDFGNGSIQPHGIMSVMITVREGITVSNLTFKPQLEFGSTPTPYVPYGSIGIVVGDTATSIDLQGNTLASLPNGTRDELHVDSAGHVVIDKRVGRILTPTDVSNVNNLTQVTGGARWNIDVDGLTGEEIPNGSTNGYCSHTPFSRTLALGSLGSHVFTFGGKVYYVIEGDFTASTAVTWVNSHQMTIIYPLATPQTIDLGYIDPPAIPSGSVVTVSASLTPTFTLEWWVDSGITALVDDLIAYIDYKTEG